jgi:hypothetical protein
MIEWLKKVLLDETESPSTKRLIALVGSAILFVCLLLSATLPFDISPSSTLTDACVWIIAICLGASTVDKFSAKKGA